jgi:hypothetical protein
MTAKKLRPWRGSPRPLKGGGWMNVVLFIRAVTMPNFYSVYSDLIGFTIEEWDSFEPEKLEGLNLLLLTM